jgi:hypothetical protein
VEHEICGTYNSFRILELNSLVVGVSRRRSECLRWRPDVTRGFDRFITNLGRAFEVCAVLSNNTGCLNVAENRASGFDFDVISCPQIARDAAMNNNFASPNITGYLPACPDRHLPTSKLNRAFDAAIDLQVFVSRDLTSDVQSSADACSFGGAIAYPWYNPRSFGTLQSVIACAQLSNLLWNVIRSSNLNAIQSKQEYLSSLAQVLVTHVLSCYGGGFNSLVLFGGGKDRLGDHAILWEIVLHWAGSGRSPDGTPAWSRNPQQPLNQDGARSGHVPAFERSCDF